VTGVRAWVPEGEPPSPFCPLHPHGTVKPCGACGNARLRAKDWENRHRAWMDETTEREALIERVADAQSEHRPTGVDCTCGGWDYLTEPWSSHLARAAIDALSPAVGAHRTDEYAEGWARDGVMLIAAERRRQVTDEGWTPEHDRDHGAELAVAGSQYALAAWAELNPTVPRYDTDPMDWPWDVSGQQAATITTYPVDKIVSHTRQLDPHDPHLLDPAE
jgi:hypothetical protein